MTLNLDSKLDNGMDQSLPSFNNSTRPGTPQETNCQRLQDITTNIKKFVIIKKHLKATINSLKIIGITDERDLSIADFYASLEEYEKLHQRGPIQQTIASSPAILIYPILTAPHPSMNQESTQPVATQIARTAEADDCIIHCPAHHHPHNSNFSHAIRRLHLPMDAASKN
ncbi:hypothetical protein TNCV_433891 [Trichonephila clavipes]|nr:hypothetical protein TNCV_433891 [Trichonephila clavipes]